MAQPESVPQPAAADSLDLDRVLACVGEAAYVWDVASDRIDWSSGAHDLLGLSAASAIDTATRFASLLDPDALTTRREAVFGSAERDLGEGVQFEVEYPIMLGARAERLWVQDRGRWFGGPEGRPRRVVGVVRRLGSRREAAERAATLARFDQLTGQLARPRLLEVASSALAAGARMQVASSFLLVCVVNLGAINEAYGFDVGDQAIVEVSRRLRAAMRGGDTLGRFSTSTFGLVLQECDRDDLEVVVRRLIAAAHEGGVATPHGRVSVRIAIGGVVAPRHARDVGELVDRARAALARARSGQRVFHIYAPDPEREALRRLNLRLADELVAALNERRLLLAYQPVFSAVTGEAVWSEALVRLEGENGEIISGGPLARAAEEAGVVHMLDHRVLDLAIGRLTRSPEARVAVNVSAATTSDPTWIEALEGWCALAPGVAERLTVEITETAAISDISVTAGFVANLKTHGVKVAIDDFGTGHTSFKALRELGADLVKIDGSFVRGLESSADSRAFVRALLALARELGLQTVAEQVETQAAADLLREWGATFLQGELLAPPKLA